MEKTTNLKTRALALLLTVLMIVGVLPMAVFALSPAENSVPTADAKQPGVEEIVEGIWNADSKYWTLGMTSSNPGYKPAYSTSAGAGRNWNGAYVSGGTVYLTATAGSRCRSG